MTEQNNSEKIRTSLMRRQNVIFVAMIIVGLFLTITSQLIDKRLLSEGIAFIIVGFVGMLMSWTTMDIGASIKEAIYDVGRQNLTVLESIAKSQNEMVKSLNEMVKSLNEMVKSLNEMVKSQNEMVKSQNEMVKSQNEMVKSLNEIKEILQDK